MKLFPLIILNVARILQMNMYYYLYNLVKLYIHSLLVHGKDYEIRVLSDNNLLNH